MKEVHMSHYLEECLARLNRVSIGAGIGTIVLAGIALVVLAVLAVIPLVGYLAVMGSQARERAVLHAGLQGEMRLRTYLRRILSDEYTAFYNVPTDRGLYDRGKTPQGHHHLCGWCLEADKDRTERHRV